jgi:hypothetical protein
VPILDIRIFSLILQTFCLSVVLLRYDGGLDGCYRPPSFDFCRNMVQNAMHTEILDGSLGIDATVQHADEVISAREYELNVMSD